MGGEDGRLHLRLLLKEARLTWLLSFHVTSAEKAPHGSRRLCCLGRFPNERLHLLAAPSWHSSGATNNFCAVAASFIPSCVTVFFPPLLFYHPHIHLHTALIFDLHLLHFLHLMEDGQGRMGWGGEWDGLGWDGMGWRVGGLPHRCSGVRRPMRFHVPW